MKVEIPDHWLPVIAQMLSDYGGRLGNDGCNDMEWPEHWTLDERRDFLYAFYRHNTGVDLARVGKHEAKTKGVDAEWEDLQDDLEQVEERYGPQNFCYTGVFEDLFTQAERDAAKMDARKKSRVEAPRPRHQEGFLPSELAQITPDEAFAIVNERLADMYEQINGTRPTLLDEPAHQTAVRWSPILTDYAMLVVRTREAAERAKQKVEDESQLRRRAEDQAREARSDLYALKRAADALREVLVLLDKASEGVKRWT